MQNLIKINSFVNKKKYGSDMVNSGVKDNWTTPMEFDSSDKVDCEDYAIKKYFELMKSGVPTNDMRISYVKYSKDRKRLRDAKGQRIEGYTNAGGKTKKPEPHMVLMVNGLVLDNLSDDIKTLEDREDLDLVYQFNGNGLYVNDKWLSGVDKLSKWKDLLSRMEDEEMTDDYEDGGL